MDTSESAAAATLAPAVAQFPEATSLTQPVEPLLLDELQDLGLNSLPQLAGAERRTTRRIRRGGSFNAAQSRVRSSWQTAGEADRRVDGACKVAAAHSHDGRRLEVVLAHPFRLPQAQDLRVVEASQFVFQLVQGGRLHGQSPGDLLPDHLHHLAMNKHTNNAQQQRRGAHCTFRNSEAGWNEALLSQQLSYFTFHWHSR